MNSIAEAGLGFSIGFDASLGGGGSGDEVDGASWCALGTDRRG
jgi:hypothetical protein